jgi:hypothetical protein
MCLILYFFGKIILNYIILYLQLIFKNNVFNVASCQNINRWLNSNDQLKINRISILTSIFLYYFEVKKLFITYFIFSKRRGRT